MVHKYIDDFCKKVPMYKEQNNNVSLILKNKTHISNNQQKKR